MKNTPKYKNEGDLDARRRKDDYHIGRILKYTCLFAFIIVIGFVLILFVRRCIDDKMFQYGVLDIVKQNLSGIIFTGLSILGINQYLKK